MNIKTLIEIITNIKGKQWVAVINTLIFVVFCILSYEYIVLHIRIDVVSLMVWGGLVFCVGVCVFVSLFYVLRDTRNERMRKKDSENGK